MSQHLGSFGTPRAAVDMTFDYFGETIRVHPHASDLALVDFMDQASGVDSENVYQAMQTMVEWLRQQIHPDDWDRFYAAAKGNGQQVGDLMHVAREITAAVAGFPTGESSGSPAGSRAERRRKKSGKKSKGGSSSPGGNRPHPYSREGTATDAELAQRALRLLPGRPDLQQVVADRAAHRSLTA
jgi:hypothetical protein